MQQVFGLGEAGRLIITELSSSSQWDEFFGMRLTGGVQMAVVAATIAILIGAVVGSIHAIEPSHFVPFMPHGWPSVGHAATLIFWCFLGWEAISHVTEEFEDPGRDVVRGTIIASVIISILYLATACAVIGTGSYGPGISEVSLIHLIHLSFGTFGVIIAGIITLFITTAPAIAYAGAAGRLAYAISKSGYAPRQFSLLHSVYQTPVGGLMFLLCCFYLILGIYTGIITLDVLIQIPMQRLSSPTSWMQQVWCL